MKNLYARWSILLLIVACLNLTQSSVAQTSVIPVTTTVQGQYAFVGNLPGTRTQGGNNQLFLLDTNTGDVQLLTMNELFMDAPRWDHAENQLAFTSGRTTNTLSVSNNQETVLPIDILAHPQSWSPNDTSILYSSYDSSMIPAIRSLQILDLPSLESTTLFSYQEGQILNNVPLPPLPDEVTQLTFKQISQADWNPVYTEWIAVQFFGFTSEIVLTDQGDGTLFPITFLYNLQTGQFISLDQLFTTHISGTRISWSLDGRFLALQTDEPGGGRIHLIAFEYDGQAATLQVVDSTPSEYQVLHDWIGAGDLLLSGIRNSDAGDAIHYISQIIDGTWYSTEFFRLPASVFDRTGSGDWFITASETEKQYLTCIFDQAMPSRVAINQRARVNFTTGIPLRLRSEPNFDSTVLLEMPEGTEFTVIGGSACVNSDSYYRFWQIELEDGTIGWAARAHA